LYSRHTTVCYGAYEHVKLFRLTWHPLVPLAAHLQVLVVSVTGTPNRPDGVDFYSDFVEAAQLAVAAGEGREVGSRGGGGREGEREINRDERKEQGVVFGQQSRWSETPRGQVAPERWVTIRCARLGKLLCGWPQYNE
jgi:hypothetical protein